MQLIGVLLLFVFVHYLYRYTMPRTHLDISDSVAESSLWSEKCVVFLYAKIECCCVRINMYFW